jgi:capsular polysaccharide transport system ATP-binding protein
MIIVDDVHKRYRTEHGPGEWVLQGVTFTIPPKTNVGIVGRNGAGKSTLLRLIGGIDVPTRGKVERNCRVSWPMGFGGGLKSTLTGRQNAKFLCRIHGHEDDVADRLAYIIDFCELGKAFDEPVRTYSSGMRSRLQFAISLAFDFDVYISDEITATGDTAFKEKARAAFKNLSDRAGLIMVSHGEGTLRKFCSAGIWLHEGKAYWFDDLDDALKHYKESIGQDELSAPAKLRAAPGKLLGEIAALRSSNPDYGPREILALLQEQGRQIGPQQLRRLYRLAGEQDDL